MSNRELELVATLVRIRDIASAGHLLAMRHSIVVAIDQALAEPEPAPDTRPKLTARQAEIYAFIKGEIMATGCPPTWREIGLRFGITPNGVTCNLHAIRKKGYLRWNPLKSRTLAVIGAAT